MARGGDGLGGQHRAAVIAGDGDRAVLRAGGRGLGAGGVIVIAGDLHSNKGVVAGVQQRPHHTGAGVQRGDVPAGIHGEDALIQAGIVHRVQLRNHHAGLVQQGQVLREVRALAQLQMNGILGGLNAVVPLGYHSDEALDGILGGAGGGGGDDGIAGISGVHEGTLVRHITVGGGTDHGIGQVHHIGIAVGKGDDLIVAGGGGIRGVDAVTAGTHDALLALQEDAVAAGLDPDVVQLHRAGVRAHMDGEGGGHALILGGDGDVAGLAVLIGHQCGLAVLIQVGNGGIGDTPGEAVGAVGVVFAGEGKAVGLQVYAGQRSKH